MIIIGCIVALPLSAAGAKVLQGEPKPVAEPTTAPSRDGDIAIAEEYCAARAAGTVAAYDLFIARHPGHRLATAARVERAKLTD